MPTGVVCCTLVRMLNGNRESEIIEILPSGDRDDFRPRGAGEDLSVIQVKAHDKGFTIKQSSLDGKVLDHVTYTPGKPAQVHQTGFKPYPGK